VNMWFVYQNDGVDKTYTFDCRKEDSALISPFDEGTIVRKLLPPFKELTLESSPVKLGINASENPNGCLQQVNMSARGYKLFVPKDRWTAPAPAITKFFPGHDYRLFSNTTSGGQVPIELHFSEEMDCESLKSNVKITSSTEDNRIPRIDLDSVQCAPFQEFDRSDWLALLKRSGDSRQMLSTCLMAFMNSSSLMSPPRMVA
jgi:alpha-1,3-glucan synthase